MLYLQQHTSTCDVTPRAGFMAFNLRHHKQVGVQPSSVISGETQDCPVSISLHPEVGGVNCPQVVPPSFPTDCKDAQTSSRQVANLQMHVNWDEASLWCTSYYIDRNTERRKENSGLKSSFFFFSFLPALSCLNLPASQLLQSTFYTWTPISSQTHLLNLHWRWNNFTCYSREGSLTEEVFCINRQRRGA